MALPGVPGAKFLANKGPKVIRMALHGHANRPFFHIVLTNVMDKYELLFLTPDSSEDLYVKLYFFCYQKFLDRDKQPVEQLGTYDPLPNRENQKLLSLNIERTRYWMGQGAEFSENLAHLLGRS